MITVTTLRRVPPVAQGLVRDLRVRWALEEAGLPYRVRQIDPEDQASPDYRAHQPFGQIPLIEEDGMTLFESGSIVLHIGARSEALLPADPAARARATTWLIAALNSVETVVQQLGEIDLFAADQDWAKARRPMVEAAVRQRLAALAVALGEAEYLDERFTAGDLMMTTVLRNLRHTGLVAETPSLRRYLERCEARPAFRRALQDHLAAFETRH